MRSLQDREVDSPVRDPHASENQGYYEWKDGLHPTERYELHNITNALGLTRPSESPLRVPDLCISIATEDDPSDFLEDLAAAVEGIKI